MTKELGYDERKGPITQLKRLLDISDKQFLDVKNTIKSQTLATLDVGLMGQSQTKKLLAVEKTLQRTHPEIFNTKQKLAFSRQVAMHFHRQARREIVRGVIRTSQSHDSTSGHGDASGACVGPHIADDPLKSVPTLTAADSSVSSRTTAQGPSTAPSAALPTIHAFLQKCAPSMEHLLSRFVDLGFHSWDILHAVANRWTADERRSLLKRLHPSDGKAISELELAALENGFSSLRSTK